MYLNWSLDLPISLKMGVLKPKSVPLNLNWYRNAHFYELNSAKVQFGQLIKAKLKDLPILVEGDQLTLVYTLYPRTRQLCDVANVCSIVDKFFCDTLTTNGIIPDDNYLIVPATMSKFGAVDPKNPRATVNATIKKGSTQ